MLEIEFIESPDLEIVGNITYYRPLLTIGKAHSCDIVIDDDSLLPVHFTLKLTSDGILCSSDKDSPFYLSNGKKIAGSKIHKPNDIIGIGQTKFKIVRFEFSKEEDLGEILKSEYLAMAEKRPVLKDVLVELEKELVILEKEINAQK